MVDRNAPPFQSSHAVPVLPPAASRKRRRVAPPLPPPRWSGRLLVRLEPSKVGLFRFLLEAYEHVAYFTVLERRAALLKVVFSPHREHAARAALAEISATLALELVEWPVRSE